MEQRVSVRKQTVHRPSVYVLRATMDTTVRMVSSSEIVLLFPGALYFVVYRRFQQPDIQRDSNTWSATQTNSVTEGYTAKHIIRHVNRHIDSITDIHTD